VEGCEFQHFSCVHEDNRKFNALKLLNLAPFLILSLLALFLFQCGSYT
jgi:hypothetical protein